MPKSQKITQKPKQQKCYLHEAETSVLRELQVEWNKQPDKNSRDSFVTGTVLPKIQQLNKEKFGPEKISKCKESRKLWEKRVKAIFGWFRNHKPYKDKAVFKVQRKLQLRWVVGRDRAAEVDQLVKSTYPGVEKGDKTYPGKYQKCLTAYVNSLGKEEKAALQEKRDKWQEEGPPMEVRLRAAKKYSRKAIANMHTTLHKEMNVHCLTFDFHLGEDGKMVLLCHDYVSALCGQNGGDKFLPFHLFDPNGYARVMNTVLDYTRYVRQKLEKKGDTTDQPADGKFNTELILKGPGGLPSIPKPCPGVKGHEIAELLKDIVREYFTTHYRLATGRTTARPPWKAIGENPGAFFDADCIPAGFAFQDPSRMGQSVKKLVDHLRERQEEFGVNAFRFTHVAVSGLSELQPAFYPLEVQVVIDAGKSVKDWPTAADIPIDLRLSRVDEDPQEEKDGETDLLEQHQVEATRVAPSSGDDLLNDLDLSAAMDQRSGSPSGLHESRRSPTASRSVNRTTDQPDPMGTISLMDVDDTGPETFVLPSHVQPPPSQGIHQSMDQTQTDNPFTLSYPGVSAPNLLNPNPDTTPQIPFNFPQHTMGLPYYYPFPQQFGGLNQMPHQTTNPGPHPFMPQMLPEQWAFMQGNPYFHNQNINAAPNFRDPPKSSVDSSLLPPGKPTFSFPVPQDPFCGQPPGNPFYGQGNTPASSSSHPITQNNSTSVMPPKGTPSPKKSPSKRGRGKSNADAPTPTRRSKRLA